MVIAADIPGAVQRGLQFRQAAQLRPGALQSQQFGLQRQEQQLATGALQQQQIQQGIETEQQRAKSQGLFNTVARLRTLPDNQKGAFLEQNIIDIESRPDGDATESRQALNLIQQGNFSELNEGLDNLFQAGVNTGFLKAEPVTKPAAGFTLSPGQQRFGPGGERIAQVAPRAETRAAEAAQAVIPDVLLQGLDPDIASKGAAAFQAAGGGKDGLTAFQKIVDKGTEQQRRAASPQILKSSFPKASPAETVQLQAAMDAAKTTEAGLKAAGKVREEQRRDVKGKVFQNRAIELLTGILNNAELDDVLGAVEGAIDFRLQDTEAELIADIEEAGNILTADNLSLMSGVLSETDIKILANLAGGALIRTRTEARFVKDVTKLRDKLAAQLIVTADDTAAARGAAQTLPPSGRQGGQLMTDAQGNRAFVFPDGTFEEVQ
jgi:hypothetical protein